MSDDGKKTLGLMGGSRSGNVKQSFSHGRTKNVVVETKRKRVVVPKPGAAKPAAPGAVRGGDPARRPAGISDAEMERRLKAVQAAKARETEDAARRAQEDLERVQTYLTGAYPLRFDGNESIAHILASMQFQSFPLNYVNVRNDLIRAVTLEDIQRVAVRLAQPEALHFVVVGQPQGLN